MLIGTWKNFEELEESLSVEELTEILKAARKRTHEQNRFLASLQNINLGGDEESGDNLDPVERAKIRVAAREAGVSEDQLDLSGFGLGYVEC